MCMYSEFQKGVKFFCMQLSVALKNSQTKIYCSGGRDLYIKLKEKKNQSAILLAVTHPLMPHVLINMLIYIIFYMYVWVRVSGMFH